MKSTSSTTTGVGSGGTELALDRQKFEDHTYWTTVIGFALVFGLFFGLGILLALIYAFGFGRSLARRQAAAQSYRIDGDVLRVDGGVYFLSRKSIPLSRITDLVLVQGPVMRHFGMWAMRVQTAGTGTGVPEATLFALEDPQAVRDQILALASRSRDQ